MADDKIGNKEKEKAKGVGAGATYGVRHQPEQESRPKNMQQGESREKLSDYPDYDAPRRPMKTQEPRSEDH